MTINEKKNGHKEMNSVNGHHLIAICNIVTLVSGPFSIAVLSVTHQPVPGRLLRQQEAAQTLMGVEKRHNIVASYTTQNWHSIGAGMSMTRAELSAILISSKSRTTDRYGAAFKARLAVKAALFAVRNF